MFCLVNGFWNVQHMPCKTQTCGSCVTTLECLASKAVFYVHLLNWESFSRHVQACFVTSKLLYNPIVVENATYITDDVEI